MNLLADLQARGLIHDSTDRESLQARLASGPVGVYVGFDPTADSLHVGHLLGQLMLRRFQMAGHRPYPLAGGATGMVGDPSGRSEERNLLDVETLSANVEKISLQLQRLLDFSGTNAATLVNNADWTRGVDVLDFLRDVGKHITVNQMLGKDSVKSRLAGEQGLSFTEFSYMLLQANDFRHLFEKHNVEMQMGGSDQWGNITAGIDLIRKSLGGSGFGLTWPLVTRADGTKFGKTADGAVWLDPVRTSPYQFRQFWIQQSDEDTVRYLKQFSLAPMSDCESIIATHLSAPEKRIGQRSLAEEMTVLVHGADVAAAAAAAADVLFGGDPNTSSAEALAVVAQEVPTVRIGRNELGDLVTVLQRCGLATSNGDARRTISQKGLRVNGAVIDSEIDLGGVAPLQGKWLLLRKGKTNYHMIELV